MPSAPRPLLVIETSGAACSVALALKSGLMHVHEVIPRGHHERLPAMIDSLMREADLTGRNLAAVAFGRGPGSFTGVRLAAATVQAWSLAHGLPVYAVSSLAALALQAGLREAVPCRIVPVVRARPGEVYTADFDCKDGMLSRLSEDRRVLARDCRPARAEGCTHLMVGDACPEVDAEGWQVDPSLLASAQAVSVLADQVPAVAAQAALPVYLGPDSAWGEQRKAP